MTSVTVVDGDTTVVTVTTAGPQGATGTVSAAASGTATDPGITFISDPNTGIYNPSADNLSFSTGGVQRLSIASDGTINVVGNLTEGGNNVVSVGDTGTVTSAMILDGTIVNGDINASAAIADTKLATIATAGKVSNSATTATNANTASAIVARDASGNFSAGTITAALTGNASTVTTNANLTGDVTSVGNATSIAAGVIVNADVNASAAIAGTKISPDFGSQTITTTGVVSAALGAAATPSLTFTGDPNTGIYRPGADQFAISTGGTGRVFVDAGGGVGLGTSSIAAALDVQGLTFDLGNAIPGYASDVTPVLRLEVNNSSKLLSFKHLYGGDNILKTIYSYNGSEHIWTSGNATEVMRVDTSNGLTLTGPGIKFPATAVASADPNTLDDYEEGTWTPTDASGAGLSFTTSLANYTKVGRLVTAGAFLTFPVTANTSAVKISLPFTSGNFVGTGMVRYTNVGAVHLIYVNPTAANFSLYTTSGAGINNVSYSTLRIDFQIVYYV